MNGMRVGVLGGLLGVALLGLTACETARYRGRDVEVGVGRDRGPRDVVVERGHRGGPPDHAPAHGYRRKFEYRYYRSAQVYYEPARRLYWYIRGGQWEVTGRLPEGIILGRDYVTFELETDTPYTYFDEHRSKYPPQGKGPDRGKGQDRGRGKGNR